MSPHWAHPHWAHSSQQGSPPPAFLHRMHQVWRPHSTREQKEKRFAWNSCDSSWRPHHHPKTRLLTRATRSPLFSLSPHQIVSTWSVSRGFSTADGLVPEGNIFVKPPETLDVQCHPHHATGITESNHRDFSLSHHLGTDYFTSRAGVSRKPDFPERNRKKSGAARDLSPQERHTPTFAHSAEVQCWSKLSLNAEDSGKETPRFGYFVNHPFRIWQPLAVAVFLRRS